MRGIHIPAPSKVTDRNATGHRRHARACTLVYRGTIANAVHPLYLPLPAMSLPEKSTVYGTEDLLISLCNSVTRVLGVATHSQIHHSGIVQRISKGCPA